MYLLLILMILGTFILHLRYDNIKITSVLSNVILIFFTIINGIRYDVGIDYFNYEHSFIYKSEFSTEFLYFFLEQVVKAVFSDFVFLTIIMSVLTNFFIYLALNNRGIFGLDRLIAVCFYLFFLGIPSFNLMRQSLSVAILYYSISYVVLNKRRFFLLVLLATGFHLSSIIFIPLYYFFVRKPKSINVKYYLLMVLMMCITNYFGLLRSFFSIIGSVIPNYSDYSSWITGSKGVTPISLRDLAIVLLVMMLMVFINSSLNKKSRTLNSCTDIKEENELYKNVDSNSTDIFLFQIGTIINVLVMSSFMFNRISLIFLPFGISGVVYLYNYINNSRIRLFVKFFVFVVLIILLINDLFITSDLGHIAYRTIFSR